jgi:GNAT superfamily N-acetyltransferase
VSEKELTITEIPLGDPRLKDFVRFPWKLYKGDPCWTPPLNGDLLGNKLLGLKGLLTPHHGYHRHAEVTHFLAKRGKEIVGRISAAINRQFNEHYQTSMGFFGFFEVIEDYEVARSLLDSARQWVLGHGATVLRGPGEYSNATHERQGILIDGFQYPPTVELTHNPPYYAEFLERYGFQKAKDYIAHLIKREEVNVAFVNRLARTAGKLLTLETRPIEMSKLREEVRMVMHIYNEAWAQNWGFLPISDEEADAIADTLRLIIDPEMIRFAYVEGKPVAVLGVLPDPNYALRPRWRWYGDSDLVRIIRLLIMRRRIPRLRGMFFGIKPDYRVTGIPALIAGQLLNRMWERNYLDVDGSLMLEDNHAIIKVIETFGGKYYKRWRIYDLPLK